MLIARPRLVILALALVALGCLAFGLLQSGKASAQLPGQAGGQPPGGGQFPPMGPGMQMGPMMGPASIVAAEGYVYVVRGNTLYQFSRDRLEMTAKAQLETPMPPGGPMPPQPPGGGQ